MKKIFTVFLLLPALLFAQNKGDNAIVIPNDVSLQQIKAVLFKNGYLIINSDSIFINTSEKEVPKSAILLKIMIARIDSVTYIKGQSRTTTTITVFGATAQNDFATLEFKGMKGSPNKDAWNEMDRIAKLISPTVSYVKQ